jgi:beta-galactosidase
MKLRTNDPDYIRLVDRWWNVLLPKFKPYLYEHGGPIVMIQVQHQGFA